MTELRSKIVADIASFPGDGWVFRTELAKWNRCDVRTVQRAITQAQDLGILRCARAKKHETRPRGSRREITCGYSHRWIPWRNLHGHAAEVAIQRERIRRLLRPFLAPRRKHAPRYERLQRLDELRQRRDENLARLAVMEGCSVEQLLARARAGPSDHN